MPLIDPEVFFAVVRIPDHIAEYSFAGYNLRTEITRVLHLPEGIQQFMDMTPDTFRWSPDLPGASPLYPILGVLIYFLLIGVFKFILRGFIPKSYQPIHNLILCGLSLLMCIKMGLAGLAIYGETGSVRQFVCTQQPKEHIWDGPFGYWTYVYYLSKYFELIDTFMLASNGKSIIFLHWYHHSVMLWAPWFWFTYPWIEGSSWCVFVNSFIHVLMYWYYYRASIGLLPTWGKVLTNGQIVQFFTGMIVVMANTFLHFFSVSSCTSNAYTGIANFCANTTFLALFFHMRSNKYSRSKAPRAKRD